MIQFNLLPDVKLEFIKTQRAKRLIMLIASLVTAVSLTMLILLFGVVNGLQKNHLNNLSEEIAENSKLITDDQENIERILTIQNQLNSLPDLHNQKPVASRLFAFIQQITPTNVSIARMEVNFTDTTMTIVGAADNQGTVNKFIDTFKFTEFSVVDDKKTAFSEVVMTASGRDAKGVSYTINLKFDPAIFSSENEVSLIIPNIITTRSQLERPTDQLIQPLSEPADNQETP